VEEPKVVKVQWSEVDRWSRVLTAWSKDQKFTDIIAIEKGGLVPGIIIANELGLPLYTIKAQRKSTPNCSLAIEEFRMRYPQSFFLVVDDIIDEGETMIAVAKMLKIQDTKFRTVSMLYKSHSKYKPDYYVARVGNEALVVFPWENEKRELKTWREWNERHTE
jgi:hypoxanthine phosphoribosyltransferase